jgi:predicted DNA-binding transcriptional regulator AlpA
LNDTDLITVLEAAERLRTPAATLGYWRHVGIEPKSFKIGRRVVYRRDDLEAWVETQRKQSA